MGSEREMNIAVLMTCHDRRETTLACLRSLFAALGLADGADAAVFLVDDGSTDGTGEAVLAEFPQVRVVPGDGTLYWAKGMRRAWEAAVAERGDWNGYLWLNDDTTLDDTAVRSMLAANDGERIVVGELANAAGEVVYGLRGDGIFTGNCVLVPRRAYERLGMICGGYSHAWADSDYALHAKRAGVAVASAGVVGRADGHPNRPSLRGLSLRERLRLLGDPKGWCVRDLWLYRRRNWGVCAAVFSCAHLVAHVMVGERGVFYASAVKHAVAFGRYW